MDKIMLQTCLAPGVFTPKLAKNLLRQQGFGANFHSFASKALCFLNFSGILNQENSPKSKNGDAISFNSWEMLNHKYSAKSYFRISISFNFKSPLLNK